MKKTLLIFNFLLIFVACRDGHTSLEFDTPLDTACIESCIEEGFRYYIKDMNRDNLSTPDTEYYCVIFTKFCNDRDTMVLIVRYRNDAYKEGYKGCAAIGRYKVLVFDEDNLGSDFYKINLLKNDKPCDSGAYPRGSEDELLMALGMIKHDSVFDFFGCIPPDDWEPIPIRRKR